MALAAADKRIARTPEVILADAFDRFGPDRISVSFSGAEDVVLIDMGVKLVGNKLSVFCLDTGRLFPDTYRFIEQVRTHYSVSIDMLGPDQSELRRFVKAKGLFSFYEDGHTECCGIRKIDSLRCKLAELDAWVTGQRRDQAVTRKGVKTEQLDPFSTAEHTIVKFNPLALWTSDDVWAYIRANNVPYNPLHDRGFKSIGCEPCSRPVAPHEPERAGRWWWEDETLKECGIHQSRVPEQVIAPIH